MQVNIIISQETNPSKKKLTTTITYIRPESNTQKLRQLATNLIALTTNSYISSKREIVEEL